MHLKIRRQFIQKLFNGGFISESASVIIKALEAKITENDGFSRIHNCRIQNY
jgi:hypothetical protein